jgi:N-acetylglucosamine malate deacetylase 1
VRNLSGAGGETIVLAVGAHPDDLEEVCGGTLVLLARRGIAVHMACGMGGECGVAGAEARDVRDTRLREAAASAEIAGASFHYLGLADFTFDADVVHDAQLSLLRLIRDLGANLLVTHPPDDYHADHRLIHHLVTNARIAAGLPNVGEGRPLPGNPDLVYMDSALGVGFDPHVWIDIDDAYETRQSMVRAHQSQQELVHGQQLEALGEALARLRGAQRGCVHAEAFRGCGLWPNPDGGIRRLVRILET